MTERGLYDWFAASVPRHAGSTALEVAGHRLTYARLDQVVGRLAARLVPTGGARPARVGLLASRSLTAYAGYLAALRLGAAVVPLNPAAPAARNAAVCRLAGVDTLVADDAGAGSLDSLRAGAGPIPALHLPTADAGGLLTGPVADLPPARCDPDGLAYLLFTSGSTGTPKGVPIRHRNLAPYLAFSIARYGGGPGCRFSQTYELTFDPSVLDLFTCWGSGGTLVVPAMDDLMQPVRFVRDREITHWSSVPSLISMAHRSGALTPGAMPSLRWSLFAGEQLTREHAYAWAAAAPASTVENCYGPTELTVTCAAYRLPADPADHPATANGTVPIGSVHPHLEHVLVDERGRVAEEGELCVRGPQRFGGYADPRDTAGHFLTFDEGCTATGYDGTGPLTDAHWYRTGDRVRRDGGLLTHLGRIDNQVKIRGYRVEPGEIEAVLRGHAGVEDAVVVPVPEDGGGIELVAFYTGRDVPAREFLGLVRAALPMYMMPRRFTRVAELPLTANGKTDRERLVRDSGARV